MAERINTIPVEVLAKILRNIQFEKVADLRLVSRHFNTACRVVLGTGHTDQQREIHTLVELCARPTLRRKLRRTRSKFTKFLHILMSLRKEQFFMYNSIETGKVCFFAGRILDIQQTVLEKMRRFEAQWYDFCEADYSELQADMATIRLLTERAAVHFDKLVLNRNLFNLRHDTVQSLKTCEAEITTFKNLLEQQTNPVVLRNSLLRTRMTLSETLLKLDENELLLKDICREWYDLPKTEKNAADYTKRENSVALRTGHTSVSTFETVRRQMGHLWRSLIDLSFR